MILDSSAIVAVLIRESGHENLIRKIREASVVAVGAPTLFETAMVMTRAGVERSRNLLLNFRATANVEVVPFETRHVEIANEAFMRFGKGRHPAALNILDCMTYATARVAGEPLLFIGNDFARTDIAAA